MQSSPVVIGYGQQSGEFDLPHNTSLDFCSEGVVWTFAWDQKLIVTLRMMPENSEYGQWPRSGEIDIVEARGNDVDYPSGGRDTCSSTIHWGM